VRSTRELKEVVAVSIGRRQFIRLFGYAAAGLGTGAHRVIASPVKRVLPTPDLDFLPEALMLMRRSEWTDLPPRTWRMRAARDFDRLTVHHAGNGIEKAVSENAVMHKLDGVLAAHMNRRYGDVGYHFVVDYAGRVWEGRSLAYEGAHVAYQNEGNIGIMLLGNFEKQKPSEAQWQACACLASALRDRFMIKRHRIYGHRDIGHSVCPGQYVYARVERLRSGEAAAV
jgi:hypothetical protein